LSHFVCCISVVVILQVHFLRSMVCISILKTEDFEGLGGCLIFSIEWHRFNGGGETCLLSHYFFLPKNSVLLTTELKRGRYKNWSECGTGLDQSKISS
jgi:hypothetical protein